MLSKFKIIKQHFELFAKDYFFKQKIYNKRLNAAMAYSFLYGGKRLRAIYSFLIGECFGCLKNNNKYIAFSLEAIHAYSIIHDDLPCMDNDLQRRGKASCHIKYDEHTAILAADALHSLAFQALTELEGITLNQLKKVNFFLADTIGSKGMISGQQYDMDNRHASLKKLKDIYNLKTGKLITASIILPFLVSKYFLDYNIEKNLTNFSKIIGLAFQIKDDLLEISQSTQTLKYKNNDIKINKNTYPRLLGIENTHKLLNDLIIEAFYYLNNLNKFNTTFLKKLTEYIILRDN